MFFVKFSLSSTSNLLLLFSNEPRFLHQTFLWDFSSSQHVLAIHSAVVLDCKEIMCWDQVPIFLVCQPFLALFLNLRLSSHYIELYLNAEWITQESLIFKFYATNKFVWSFLLVLISMTTVKFETPLWKPMTKDLLRFRPYVFSSETFPLLQDKSSITVSLPISRPTLRMFRSL